MKKLGIDSVLWLLLALFVVLTIVVYFTYDIWAVQVLSACLGAIITIIATRLLLSSQSKIEEQRRNAEDDAKRRFEIYNAKLKVYSDFVSNTVLFHRGCHPQDSKLFGSVPYCSKASGDHHNHRSSPVWPCSSLFPCSTLLWNFTPFKKTNRCHFKSSFRQK